MNKNDWKEYDKNQAEKWLSVAGLISIPVLIMWLIGLFYEPAFQTLMFCWAPLLIVGAVVSFFGIMQWLFAVVD